MGPALPMGVLLCALCGFTLGEGRGGRGEPHRCASSCGQFFQGRRTLLPLRKAEKKTVIFPYEPTIQATEMSNVVRMAGEATTSADGGGGGGREGSTPGRRALSCSSPPALGQVRELMETLPILLLFLVLCGLDWALYSIFDTIRHHSFLEYSFRSEPRLPGHPRRTPTPCAPTPSQFFQFGHLLLGLSLSLASSGSNLSPAT